MSCALSGKGGSRPAPAFADIASITLAKTLVRRKKFYQEVKVGLWEKAFTSLSREEKKDLDFQSIDARLAPSEILASIEEKKNECIRKQWKYSRSNGEDVVLREVFEKMAGWLDKFKAVGDIAVQFDTAHAALPWAAVRFFLQAAVNDVQTFGAMMEALELVSRIITRYSEIEKKDLHGSSTLKTQLSDAILRLYKLVYSFFTRARKYFGQKTSVRVAKSILNPQMSIVGYTERITKEENDVYKLVTLVEIEDQKNRLTSLHKAVSGIQQAISIPNIPMEDRRHRLIHWLNPVFTDDKLDNAQSSRHKKTCDWMLQKSQFRQWAEVPTNTSKILWLYGPPGFGKTVMCARLIQELADNHSGPVAYFFCVSEAEAKRDPYAVLKSWIAQIIQQFDKAVEAAETIYHTHEVREPTISELWQLFQHISRSMSGMKFVVDGLDECSAINSSSKFHTDDARSQFLTELLKALLETTVQVLIVSRDNVDIRNPLVGACIDTSLIERFEYEITPQDTMKDITVFSVSMIDLKLPKKPAALREEIAKDAAAKSEGMFLWLTLLKEELQPGKNAKQLRRTVSEMPAGIEQAYEKDLERIMKLRTDKRQRAIAVLRWILFSVRPLSLRELCEALALTFDDTETTYPEDDLPDSWGNGFVDEDYVNDFIKDPCGSLVVLRSQSKDEALALHTVHFVHFSVKEYLLRTNEAGQPRLQALCFLDNSSEHDMLAQLCLRYLCYDVFGEDLAEVDDPISKRLQVYPFLTYAARYWYDHASRVSKQSADITYYAKKLFDPATSNWKMWSQVFEAEVAVPESSDSDDEEASGFLGLECDSELSADDTASNHSSEIPILNAPKTVDGILNENTIINQKSITALIDNNEQIQDAAETGHSRRSPIYYASLLGLTDIIRALRTQGLDCDVIGGRYGTPLQAAILNGHQSAVEFLLGEGANVSREAGEYGFAIIAAAASGSEPIFNTLIKAGADIAVSDEKGRTALHLACQKGAIGLVRLLLKLGAVIECQTNFGETPLFKASSSGHDEIVSLLLDHKADPNIPTKFGWVPLYVATLHKREPVVATLLKRGALVDFQRPGGLTSLHLAAEMGDDSLIKLLLSHKADINGITVNGYNALHFATNTGKTSTVKLLLDNGAQVNDANVQGWAPIHLAAEYADIDTLKELLKYGANVNAENTGSWTCLHSALSTGSIPVIKLLLENGADPSLHDINGDTVLDEAIFEGNIEIVSLLLEHGALIEKIAWHSATRLKALGKLHKAAYLGEISKVETLLGSTDEIDLQQALNSALHAAAAAGKEKISMILLDKGAEVDSKGVNGRTALHLAAASGFLDLVKTLLEHGAAVRGVGDDGTEPLNLAVRHGMARVETVKLLIQHGALDDVQASFQISSQLNDIFKVPVLDVTEASTSDEDISAFTLTSQLEGEWSGSYTYEKWMKGVVEETQFTISSTRVTSSNRFQFSGAAKDLCGEFEIHGQLNGCTAWFVKLYETLGWLYAGKVEMDEEKQEFKMDGHWGHTKEVWDGTFQLTRIATKGSFEGLGDGEKMTQVGDGLSE